MWLKLNKNMKKAWTVLINETMFSIALDTAGLKHPNDMKKSNIHKFLVALKADSN
jgi:hypothetical protein